MTSLEYSPDSPDWFGGSTGGILLASTFTLPPDGTQQQGLSGGTGCVVTATSAGANIPVVLIIGFTAAFDGGDQIFVTALTGSESPDGALQIGVDLPAYGAGIEFFNHDAVNSLDVSVFTTNRAIVAPRVEPSYLPGRQFGGALALVNATPKYLPPLDSAQYCYASNGKAGVNALADTNGVLEFHYRNTVGNPWVIPMATLVAGVAQYFEVALPQCAGALWFVPAADNPAGHVNVQICPAQL